MSTQAPSRKDLALAVIERAREVASEFVDRAAMAEDAEEAANWSAAARHMAATLHSFTGAAGRGAR